MVLAALDPTLRLAEALVERSQGQPAILGICGSQGSGKSTLAAALADQVDGTAVLSIDDLYLSRAARKDLAEKVHPLLKTRGVPGTHDVRLGMAVIDALLAGNEVRMPRFEKSRDDRAPVGEWPAVQSPVRLIVLEGWCVGARPQAEACLAAPINALEREDDIDGRWRHYVNRALAGHYQTLFGRLDGLVLLAAPDFDAVLDWRIEQERALRQNAPDDATSLMDDTQIARFIAHYERLTRAILDEMPGRADLVLHLDRARQLVGTSRNG